MTGINDVNTIANFDPGIVPLLGAPVGAAFERDNGTGRVIAAHDWSAPDDAN